MSVFSLSRGVYRISLALPVTCRRIPSLLPKNCRITFQQPKFQPFGTCKKTGVQVLNIKTNEENRPVVVIPAQPISTSAPDNNATSDMPPTDSPTVTEVVVAKVGDLENGKMMEVEVDGKKLLLIKDDGQFYATGNKCTHYGAPLSKGAYSDGVVRCPWHGACFNVKTGDIEDFPGLDSIHTFEVSVKGNDVVVKVDKAKLDNHKRCRPMVKKTDDEKTAVLVGGGPATVVCAQTLREEGFKGRIVLVSKESHLPYDRIKLSKALSANPADIALRDQDYYDTNEIELLLGKEVTSLSPSDNSIKLSDGQSLTYNYLVLATGGQPRRIPIPGIDLKNIYMLRTPEDANAIHESAKDKHVVIVGSSFIGLEVSCALSGKAASVQVIGNRAVPLANVFGNEIGQWFRKMHESKGIKFHLETSVKELRGDADGQVKEVVLSNGEIIDTDVVVMGVGVVPATEFLKESGLKLSKVGYIPVSKRMETNLKNVYAAGDIVEFPLFLEDDNSVNIQHFQMAHKHGRTAALSIVGKPENIHSVPYFWTVQYGKSIRYCGYCAGYDDVVLHGNLDDNKFVAFYTKGERVVGVASLGWDPIVSQVAELFSKGGNITKDEIKSDPSSTWVSRL